MNSLRQRWGQAKAKIRTHLDKIRTPDSNAMQINQVQHHPIHQKRVILVNIIGKQPDAFPLFPIFEERYNSDIDK
jgi:hypothetical protein